MVTIDQITSISTRLSPAEFRRYILEAGETVSRVLFLDDEPDPVIIKTGSKGMATSAVFPNTARYVGLTYPPKEIAMEIFPGDPIKLMGLSILVNEPGSYYMPVIEENSMAGIQQRLIYKKLLKDLGIDLWNSVKKNNPSVKKSILVPVGSAGKLITDAINLPNQTFPNPIFAHRSIDGRSLNVDIIFPEDVNALQDAEHLIFVFTVDAGCFTPAAIFGGLRNMGFNKKLVDIFSIVSGATGVRVKESLIRKQLGTPGNDMCAYGGIGVLNNKQRLCWGTPDLNKVPSTAALVPLLHREILGPANTYVSMDN